MLTLLANPQFKIYVICCCILSMQMLVLGGMTAARRSKVKTFINPEDMKVSFKDAKLSEGAEHPDVARILRAHRNLNESLPIFFVLGLISLLAGAAPLPTTICLGVFTGGRVLHSIVYLNELQPWRTITFALSSFALMGMMVFSLLAVMA